MNDIQRVVKMYSEGMSLREIGKALGRSHVFAARKLKKAGVTRRPWAGKGPEHSQWKGGSIAAGQGYFRVWIAPDDPLGVMRDHHGYVREHRLVLAKKLGRPLNRNETVHHIDGNRSNNAPENLELRHGIHGKGIAMCCRDCGSYNVGPAELKASTIVEAVGKAHGKLRF